MGKLPTRVRASAKKLALSGQTADAIADRLRIPLVDADAIIRQTIESRQVDPKLLWAQDRRRSHRPARRH
jgi:hypothetical protein